MHAHAALLDRLYKCLDGKDPHGMAACYHPDATFEDIAFSLDKKKQIHAMWDMISKTDLRASFRIVEVNDESGLVDLVDEYTFGEAKRPVRNVIRSEFRFQDGLIIRHRDSCNALKWGMQALGPVKGIMSWLVPSKRREMAMAKLDAFIADHREYT